MTDYKTKNLIKPQESLKLQRTLLYLLLPYKNALECSDIFTQNMPRTKVIGCHSSNFVYFLFTTPSGVWRGGGVVNSVWCISEMKSGASHGLGVGKV